MGESFHYEFSGPYLGPLGIIIGLPAVCYALVFACNSSGCLTVYPSFYIPGFAPGTDFYDPKGIGAAVGYFALILLLHLILPGKKAQGAPLPNGGAPLTYKLNGIWVLFLTYGSAVFLSFGVGLVELGWIYEYYMSIMLGSLLISFVLSAYVYIGSFVSGKLLAAGGDSGIAVYDFFIGRELNPRVGGVDIKEFCELYPGLIGWVLLDLGFAHKQYLLTGSVSLPMALVNGFHLLYVADALYYEKSILTTMDITTDGFGFMLAFGDLTWVPFIYSLQARILVDHTPTLPAWFTMAILLLKLLGYTIFRGANGQKDQFRRDPNHPSVAHLKTLKTERGRLLMVSGWWGLARHINYFGDWLMGLSWCMPCGAQPVAYFYAIYFGVLLVHRDGRDDHMCRIKYGKDWDKYIKLVPYRFIPGVY